MVKISRAKERELYEALVRTECELRATLFSIGDGVISVDLDGRILMTNPVAEQMTGWNEEEAHGRLLEEVFHIINEETRAKVENPVKRVLREGTVIGLANHTILIARDGTECAIADCGSPIYDKEGRVTGVVLVFRDQTEKRKAEKAVAEALAFAESIVATVREPLVVLDAGLRVLSANRAFYRVFGVVPEETEGRLLYELGNREWDISELRRLLEDILPQNTFFEDYEVEHDFRHIGRKTMLLNARRIYREANKTDMILLAIEDIHERKQVEEVLKLSEEKFSKAFKASPAWVVISSLEEGRYIEVNDAFLKSMGFNRDEVLGKTVLELNIWANPGDRGHIIFELKEKGSVRSKEVKLRKKSGDFLDILLSAEIIEIAGEKCMLSASLDITDRKQVEVELRLSEERFRQFFENAPIYCYMVSPEGIILVVNKAALATLGYEKEELVGKPVMMIYAPEYYTKAKENLDIWKKTGRLEEVEMELITKRGERRTVLLSADAVRDRDGKILHSISVQRDITEQKLLEDQLRQSQKMEAIGRLAGGIAHDFNNLLTVIKGNSQLSLIELKEDVPLRGNIEEIKNAADRAADLTRQLLAFSRRQIMEMKVLDLNDLLKNLDKMLRRVIGEDIELVTLLAEDLGRVKADPGQIEQVIMNLSVNARDAMPEGGKLTIETANVELDGAYARNHVAVTPGRYVMISVSDTGVGMAPEVRDRVFDPFFTTKEKGKGTGLGLSTVYGIVKQSDGNIWVYSEPGKGATFKIYLPRVDEALEELRERVEVKEVPRGTETILIVEDEEEVLKLAGRILSRQGYTVLQTSSTSKALEICKERKDPLHLILTDVVMPQMSGRELIERCRETRQDFKILYMSGYTDNAITHHGVLEKGMNYLQKPFTVDSLARKVREALDK